MEYHEYANLLPLLEGKPFDDLCADIKANGLLEPIWIYQGKVLDGRNRLRACERIGAEIRTRPYMGSDPIACVLSLNLHRRHLNESQRGMVAARLSNLKRGDNQHSKEGTHICVPEADAAEQLSVSKRLLQTAKKVQREGSPELQAVVESGDVSLNAAVDVAELPIETQKEIVSKGKGAINQAAKQVRAKKARKRTTERVESICKDAGKLEGVYPVIYADPPWQYEYSKSQARAIENHYSTMSLDEIKALPVPAHNDAILFLWATSPKLTEALEVLGAWGFEYRTCAVWDKGKIGMGYYFRQQHELLLVGTRGDIPAPLPANRPPSVFSVARGQHSVKPDCVYKFIESMYPGLLKLEMFSNRPRKGWAAWGNQAA